VAPDDVQAERSDVIRGAAIENASDVESHELLVALRVVGDVVVPQKVASDDQRHVVTLADPGQDVVLFRHGASPIRDDQPLARAHPAQELAGAVLEIAYRDDHRM